MPISLKVITGLFCFVMLCIPLCAQPPVPVTAAEHFSEGLRLVDQKRYKKAIAAFEKSAELDSTRAETFANIGPAYIALKEFAKAESSFRKAIEADPENGTLHTSLCSALSLQKKHVAAVRACDEGVRLNPDLDNAHAGRLIALLETGERSEQLRSLIETALSRFRHSSLILEVGVNFYLNQRNYTQTTVLLEQLVELNPDVARYRGQLAESYLKTGRDEESLASARKALELEPANVFGNFVMGLIFFELGQHDETAKTMTKVISGDPGFDHARYILAVSESKRSRFAAAVNLMRPLTEKDPSNALYHTQLGHDLSSLRRFEEAEAAFLKANALQPREVEILAGLGMANMSLARFDKAIAYFDDALAVKPGDEILQMFSRVARGRQTLISNIPAMIKGAKERPDDLQLLFDLVNGLALAGRIEEASVYVDKIYAMAPQDPLIYQRLGVFFSEAGETAMAIKAYQRSLSTKETPDGHLGMGTIYQSDGNFALASAS